MRGANATSLPTAEGNVNDGAAAAAGAEEQAALGDEDAGASARARGGEGRRTGSPCSMERRRTAFQLSGHDDPSVSSVSVLSVDGRPAMTSANVVGVVAVDGVDGRERRDGAGGRKRGTSLEAHRLQDCLV